MRIKEAELAKKAAKEKATKAFNEMKLEIERREKAKAEARSAAELKKINADI